MHQPISDEEQEIQNKIDNINALHIPGYEEEVLKFIEDNNIDVLNRNGPLGDNLLYTACKNRATNIALALIEKGVDVNPPSDWTGNTPLIYACINSLEEVALALIEKGAYVDAKNLNEDTPLNIVCENGLEDVAMAIIIKGNIENKEYIKENKLSLLREKDPIGNTPLHYACAGGLKEVVKIILTQHPQLLRISNSISKKPIDFAITYTNKTKDYSIIYMIMLTDKTITFEFLEKHGLDSDSIKAIQTTKGSHQKESPLYKIPPEQIRDILGFLAEKKEPTSPSRKRRKVGGKTNRRRKTKRSKKHKSRRKKD